MLHKLFINILVSNTVVHDLIAIIIWIEVAENKQVIWVLSATYFYKNWGYKNALRSNASEDNYSSKQSDV